MVQAIFRFFCYRAEFYRHPLLKCNVIINRKANKKVMNKPIRFFVKVDHIQKTSIIRKIRPEMSDTLEYSHKYQRKPLSQSTKLLDLIKGKILFHFVFELSYNYR